MVSFSGQQIIKHLILCCYNMTFLIFLALLANINCENVNSSDLLPTEALLPNIAKIEESEISVESLAALPGNGELEQRCVEKVVMEEQTEWDQQIECHHRFI